MVRSEQRLPPKFHDTRLSLFIAQLQDKRAVQAQISRTCGFAGQYFPAVMMLFDDYVMRHVGCRSACLLIESSQAKTAVYHIVQSHVECSTSGWAWRNAR